MSEPSPAHRAGEEATAQPSQEGDVDLVASPFLATVVGDEGRFGGGRAIANHPTSAATPSACYRRLLPRALARERFGRRGAAAPGVEQ
jgi:hypothetical protein